MITLLKTRTSLTLSALLLVTALSAGCNGDDDDDTNTPAPASPAPTADKNDDQEDGDSGDSKWAKGTVTGNWYYKNEIMKLKQNGASIQGTTEVIGFTNNPADPVEVPVPTVGSMAADGTVKVDELLIYTKNPSKNFKIKKVGGLKNANTLVLEVISGQKAHTQTWVKK